MLISKLSWYVVDRAAIKYREVTLKELFELAESQPDNQNLEVMQSESDAEGLCELLKDIGSGREKYEHECYVGCGCEPMSKIRADMAASRQRVVDFGNSIRESTDHTRELKAGSQVFAILPVTVKLMRDGAKRVSCGSSWGEDFRIHKEDLFFLKGDQR